MWVVCWFCARFFIWSSWHPCWKPHFATEEMKAKKIRNLPTIGSLILEFVLFFFFFFFGVCTLNCCAWFKWLVGGHTCAKVQRWIECGLFRNWGDICSWNAECVKGSWWVIKLEKSAGIWLQRTLYILFEILDSLLRSMWNHLKGWSPAVSGWDLCSGMFTWSAVGQMYWTECCSTVIYFLCLFLVVPPFHFSFLKCQLHWTLVIVKRIYPHPGQHIPCKAGGRGKDDWQENLCCDGANW